MTELEMGAASGDGRAEKPSPGVRLRQVARDIAAGADRHQVIVRAAMEILGSDAASVQLYDHDSRGLRLAGGRGFDPASAAFWELVVPQSASTCGLALVSGDRVVVTDVEEAAALAGSDDLYEYRRSGLRAVQSTPLVADDGQVVGMLSTHWQTRHEVPCEEWSAIDRLAWATRAGPAELLDWAEKSDIARRQYRVGTLNRHVVRSVERLEDAFSDITGGRGLVRLFCACGRDGCEELVDVPLAACEELRTWPHRFVVARGHAAEADDVLAERDHYDIVEVTSAYRDPTPPTVDL